MEKIQKCTFVDCKLGPGNVLVGLRHGDIIDYPFYFFGDKVCALHYRPWPSRQVKNVIQFGCVEEEAKLGTVGKQKKAESKEKIQARKEKKLKLLKEQQIG